MGIILVSFNPQSAIRNPQSNNPQSAIIKFALTRIAPRRYVSYFLRAPNLMLKEYNIG
jgi:hypothetical protein